MACDLDCYSPASDRKLIHDQQRKKCHMPACNVFHCGQEQNRHRQTHILSFCTTANFQMDAAPKSAGANSTQIAHV